MKALILGVTALATLATPAVADAQYYRSNNNYTYHHRHRDRNNNGAAIAGALIGGVIGYALANSQHHNYDYAYPSYGYSNYGYSPQYNYSYPNTGYGYYNGW